MSNNLKQTYYDILGVNKNSSISEIKKIINNGQMSKNTNYQFASVVLTNPILRKMYDNNISGIDNVIETYSNSNDNYNLLYNSLLERIHKTMEHHCVLLGTTEMDLLRFFNQIDMTNPINIYNLLIQLLNENSYNQTIEKIHRKLIRYAILETAMKYIENLPKDLQKKSTIYALLADVKTSPNPSKEIYQIVKVYNHPLSSKNVDTLTKFAKGLLTHEEINIDDFEDLPLIGITSKEDKVKSKSR